MYLIFYRKIMDLRTSPSWRAGGRLAFEIASHLAVLVGTILCATFITSLLKYVLGWAWRAEADDSNWTIWSYKTESCFLGVEGARAPRRPHPFCAPHLPCLPTDTRVPPSFHAVQPTLRPCPAPKAGERRSMPCGQPLARRCISSPTSTRTWPTRAPRMSSRCCTTTLARHPRRSILMPMVGSPGGFSAFVAQRCVCECTVSWPWL